MSSAVLVLVATLVGAPPPVVPAVTGAAPAPAKARRGPAVPPPRVSLVDLDVVVGGEKPRRVKVRVAHPAGWAGDVEADGRTIRMVGPDGEGELTISVAWHPSQLGPLLGELKQLHPAVAPSPPQFIELPGIDPQRGERATRFEITGRELGELVTIERGGLIVFFGTLVRPDAWDALAPIMKRCYPSVSVIEG